jgi:molybdopterin synthase catalytic subunit
VKVLTIPPAAADRSGEAVAALDGAVAAVGVDDGHVTALTVEGSAGAAAVGACATPAEAVDAVCDAGADYAVLAGVEDAVAPHVALDPDFDASAAAARAAAAPAHETRSSLVRRVEGAPDSERAGAVVAFTGRVRVRDRDDDPPTEYLEYERYEPVAGERIAGIEEDLAAREDVIAAAIHHRGGRVPGEVDIVHVAAAAGHRDAAFRAARDGIDRVKSEVPIFKREVTVEGSVWAHQRDGGCDH